MGKHGGRPPKAEEEKRNIRVYVRLTLAEYDKLRTVCRQEMLGPWAREAIWQRYHREKGLQDTE